MGSNYPLSNGLYHTHPHFSIEIFHLQAYFHHLWVNNNHLLDFIAIFLQMS
jgi:hypothetical protein